MEEIALESGRVRGWKRAWERERVGGGERGRVLENGER